MSSPLVIHQVYVSHLQELEQSSASAASVRNQRTLSATIRALNLIKHPAGVHVDSWTSWKVQGACMVPGILEGEETTSRI